jgi:DNA-binding MarR family transcriptional regulator
MEAHGTAGDTELSRQERVVGALLVASRALVAVAARSLDDLDEDVTLPQYRALVVLGTRGPQSLTGLADQVGIHVSSAHRLTNRLVVAGLLHRVPVAGGSREVTLDLTAQGRHLLERVLERRRAEITRIVDAMTPEQQDAAIDALQTFAQAAGEGPEQTWSWGWTS